MTEGGRKPSRLARAVRMERDRKGWTSERLADAARVSHSWVRNFEAGIIANPGADKLRALEEALELRVGELYAASLNIPYDKLVADLLTDQDRRNVPWESLLAGQAEILTELRALTRRFGEPMEGLAQELDALIAARLEQPEHTADARLSDRDDEQTDVSPGSTRQTPQ